jgi:DNA-binding transcriptional MerR regulator
MATYSIKDIEQLTGIRSHTLRIWERRYELLLSKRTETNIRFYDEEDLKYLLQTALLLNGGYRISKISQMGFQERANCIEKISSQSEGGNYEIFIHKLILSMIDMNEVLFNNVIQECFALNGVEFSMFHILYPFLERIGIMWIVGSANPANEHFITNLIRQKLIAQIDKLPIPSPRNSPTYLLFLPEGELHEISLLFLNYMLRARGNYTLYLGQNTPVREAKEILTHYTAKYIFTIFTSSSPRKAQEMLNDLQELSNLYTIMVAGRVILDFPQEQFPSLNFLYSAADVRTWLELQNRK